MGAFEDLIPAKANAGAFDDLIPKNDASPFADLIPDSSPASKQSPPSEDLRQFLNSADPNALSPSIVASDNLGYMDVNPMTPIVEILPHAKPRIKGDVLDRAAGIGQDVIADTINGMTSPAGIATLGFGAIGGVAIKAISTAFLTHAAIHAPERFAAIRNAKTPEERDQAIVGAIEDAGIIGGTGKHLFGRPSALPMGATRPAGLPQEVIDRVATQNELQQLAPATAAAIEPKPTTAPEILDGLHTARVALSKDFTEQTPDVQQNRQEQIDSIDEQLLRYDGNQVKESAARTTLPKESTPPAEAAAPQGQAESPLEQGGRSTLFTQALEESGAPLTAATIEHQNEQITHRPASETSPAEPLASGAETGLPNAASERGSPSGASGVSDVQARGSATESPPGNEAERAVTSSQVEAPPYAETTPAGEPAAVDARFKKVVAAEISGLHEAADESEALDHMEGIEDNRVREQIAKQYGIETEGKNVNELNMEIADKAMEVKAAAPVESAKVAPEFPEEESGGGLPKESLGNGGSMTKRVGFSEGPGAASDTEFPAQQTTGLKKSVVDTERLARGAEPIPPEARKSEEGAVQRAEDKMDADPTAAPGLVSRIVDEGKTAINQDDAALLLTERNRLMNERRLIEQKAGSVETSPTQRAEGKSRLGEIEVQLERLDRAQRATGSAWGRLGHMYQRLIQEDYTLAAMERKERASRGRPLTEPERAKIAEQAAKIEKLQKTVDESQSAISEGQAHETMARIYEATIKSVERELAQQPKISKPVLEIARGIVDRWQESATEARKSLHERLGRTSAGVDPTIVLDVAKIMRAHIGELGLKSAEVFGRLVDEFGESVKPYLKDAWANAKKLVNDEKTTVAVKEAVKKGVPKAEKTTGDFKAKAKAEATAGEDLSHQTVYELARTHIKAGVHGEDAVMKAVHAGVKEAYPDATERDVRRAFSEYGKVKFPSKEAVATELRELRTLTRLQESIDRLKSDQDAMHSGLQRDKATQVIREKQSQLNELLKKRQGPPSPEKLASRDEAKQTALRNAIADLDKQLRTGEKPTKGEPIPDSGATAQLRAERDAMREKLNEIEDAAKPVKTSEEIYNETQRKNIERQTAEAQRRIAAGDYSKPPKRVPLELDAKNKQSRIDLQKLKNKIDEERMKIEEGNRTRFQKATDTIAKLNRANVLGHISVLEHLAGAAVENIVTRPVGTALAQVMRFNKTLNAIRQKATYEGGFSVKSEGAGITGTLKSSKALWDKLTKGKSDIDWLNNAKRYPKSFMDIVSNVHGAIKEPVRQGIYSRSMELRTKAAEEMGLDPTHDPVLAEVLSKEAYDDANMDIFMGDNFLTKALHNNATAYLRKQSKIDPGLSKFTADVLDILFPVVNVSTNIAIRKFRLLAGLPESAVRLGVAAKEGKLANNAETLTPREAELITKTFKYGAIGAALGIYAWNHPQQFGGIYTLGKQAPKDNKNDLEKGDIALPGGGHISHHFLHGPVGGHMNAIADARRIYDSQVRGHPENKWSALTDASFFSLFSGANGLPAFSTVARLASPFKSAGQKAGEMARNMFIFGALQDAAAHYDTDKAGNQIKREPKTFVQEMKVGVPRMREQVPIKKHESKKR